MPARPFPAVWYTPMFLFQQWTPLFTIPIITCHWPHHILTLYPRSNGFIERQIKTIKDLLNNHPVIKHLYRPLLQTLCSTPTGPNLPSPCEILNHRDPRPGQPSTPIDLEHIRDYLITKKSTRKHYYDKKHNARPYLTLTRCPILESCGSDVIPWRHHCESC